MSTIISSFMSSGKAGCVLDHSDECVEIDSNKYMWIFDGDVNTGVMDLKFPRNFIKEIKNQRKKMKYILVDSTDATLSALQEAGLTYTRIIPDADDKDGWVRKWIQLGCNTHLVTEISNNWPTYTDGQVISSKYTGFTLVKLTSGQTVSDYLTSLALPQEQDSTLPTPVGSDLASLVIRCTAGREDKVTELCELFAESCKTDLGLPGTTVVLNSELNLVEALEDIRSKGDDVYADIILSGVASAKMNEKLKSARDAGKQGWYAPELPDNDLKSKLLVAFVEDDMVSVMNYAAMLMIRNNL